MKRILHIIPSLDRSGAEKQMSMLVRGLPKDEFDVHVCVLTRTGPLEAELREAGIPLTMINKQWRADPLAYWRLRRFIGSLQPDLIHTWLFAANSYGRAAGIACGVKCLVAGERCVDPWKGWLEFAVDRRLARRTSRIVANSPGVKDFYVEHGLPADLFTVIHNGIHPAPAASISRRQLLEELGLPQDCLLIGVVGRLWPQKRVKDAIWAADLLQVIRKDFRMLVIGEGPHRRRLEIFRAQCHVNEYVHFLGHRSDVPRLLPHFDVFLSTSAYEGQSNSIMEAMAAGVPVVGTDIPGTRDLIVDGQTGLLAPLGDRGNIARQVNTLLNDAPLRRRLGDAGRQRMLGEFSVEQMIQRHVQLYRELLARNAS